MTTIATRPISRSQPRVEPQSNAAELKADQISTLHRDFPALAGLAAAIVTSTAVTWDSFAAQMLRFEQVVQLDKNKPTPSEEAKKKQLMLASMWRLDRFFSGGHKRTTQVKPELETQVKPELEKEELLFLRLRQAVKAALGGKGASYQNIAGLLEKKLPPQKLVPTHNEPAPTKPAESKSSVSPAPSQPRVSAALRREITRNTKQLMSKPIVWNPADNQAVFIHCGYEIPNMHDLRAALSTPERGLSTIAFAYAMLVVDKEAELPLAYSHFCEEILTTICNKPAAKISDAEVLKLSAALGLEGRRVFLDKARMPLVKTAILLLHSLQNGQDQDPLAELLRPGEVLARDVTIGEMQSALRCSVYNGLVSIVGDRGPRNDITVVTAEELAYTGLVESLISMAVFDGEEYRCRGDAPDSTKRRFRSMLMLHEKVLVPGNEKSFWLEVSELTQIQLAGMKEEVIVVPRQAIKPTPSVSGAGPISLVALAGKGLRR
jgi:hypothetical protein